jgi:hypothetical protein
MWRTLCATGATAQVIFRQDLQDEQDFLRHLVSSNVLIFAEDIDDFVSR